MAYPLVNPDCLPEPPVKLLRPFTLALCLLFAACNQASAPAPEPELPEVSQLAASAEDGAVQLMWSDASPAAAGPVQLSWQPADGGPQPLLIDYGTRAARITGLHNGTRYTFNVRTSDATGQLSDGTTLSATPQAGEDVLAQSTEVGERRDQWINDDGFVQDTAPTSGMLFGVWTRVPPDWSNWEHNLDVLDVHGTGWTLRCLVANITRQALPDINPASRHYNANTMVLYRRPNGGMMWSGDYNWYLAIHPETEVLDWVWVGWQVVVHENRFTLRQWLKFGPHGTLIKTQEDHPTFAELRQWLKNPANNPYEYSLADPPTPTEIDAWTPGPITSFNIGIANAHLWNAMVQERVDEPSMAELEALTRWRGPHAHLWGHWSLTWTEAGPDYQDQSGHHRPLRPNASDAVFKAGHTVPDFRP